MIIGTGVDITETERIAHAMQKSGFLSRCFSEDELVLFKLKNNNVQTVSANFCAKEAFAKALGTGVRGFNLCDISVLRDDLGKPYITVSERVAKILADIGVSNIFVSLSHCEHYAVAQVILEKQ